MNRQPIHFPGHGPGQMNLNRLGSGGAIYDDGERPKGEYLGNGFPAAGNQDFPCINSAGAGPVNLLDGDENDLRIKDLKGPQGSIEGRMAFWRELSRLATGPMAAGYDVLANRYQMLLQANGVVDFANGGYQPTAAGINTSVSPSKDVATRRNNIVNSGAKPANVAIPYPVVSFSVVAPPGSTTSSQIVVSGVAPRELAWLMVNNLPSQPIWTSERDWKVTVPIAIGQNTLVFQGRGAFGYATTVVTYTVAR